MKRRHVLLAAVVVVLTAVATIAVILKVRRDHEWAHGGDQMIVTVETLLADRATFDNVTGTLGVPPGKSSGLAKAQAAVVKVTWSGWAADDGWFRLLALDKRVSPPRVLVGEGGWTSLEMAWNPDGTLGSSWISSYDKVLAEHYDWLAGLVPTRRSDGSYTVSYTSSPAVDLPARRFGTATVWFTLPDNSPPLTDPSNIAIGLLYVSSAEHGPRVTLEDHIRWAKRIYG